MKTIKTSNDIQTLYYANVMDCHYLQHLKDYFHQLYLALQDNESEKEFSLKDRGYIVILEKGDNLRDLSEVGLNPEDHGLLGSYPEFVDLIELEFFPIYKIGVLYNNDYMMTFFSEKGIHDPEIESWLQDESS